VRIVLDGRIDSERLLAATHVLLTDDLSFFNNV
jgi:hypothetical protein